MRLGVHCVNFCLNILQFDEWQVGFTLAEIEWQGANMNQAAAFDSTKVTF